MSNYAQHVSVRHTQQSEPIPGKAQVPNSAGGHVFALDDWARLDRFLILGNEGGTYYAGERKLTQENAAVVGRCADLDHDRLAERIAVISESGRAPRNDPAMFALALLASHRLDAKEQGRPAQARQAALARLSRVCRTGYHLFQFVAACKEMRGGGRALRTGLANWYLSKDPAALAYQLVKYQSRAVVQGNKAKGVKAVEVSHRGILRRVHPATTAPVSERVVTRPGGKTHKEYVYGTTTNPHDLLIRWASQGVDCAGLDAYRDPTLSVVWAFERAKSVTSAEEMARLVSDHRLPRECVPTKFLTSPVVWEALLPHTPLHALVRNLATMTRVGLLAPLSNGLRAVRAKLGDAEYVRRSRLHPLVILNAMNVYASGKGDKGHNTWTPLQEIKDVLDESFYLAFQGVVPTGARHLLALDVSGSMNCGSLGGMPTVSPRVGSAAMALVTARTEADTHVVGFTSGGWGRVRSGWANYPSSISPLNVSPRQRLDDVVRAVSDLPMGGTDCALPMLYAAEHNIPVDAFVIYTDNETWAGDVHPCQALRMYRDKTGIGAKLIVVGMTATNFTIADPSDPGSMDVVGFDAAAPAVMADFVRESSGKAPGEPYGGPEDDPG